MRSVDPETGDVTYTANWIEVVERSPKVTYIDPRAAAGGMILASGEYANKTAAADEATAGAKGTSKNAPADPSHGKTV